MIWCEYGATIGIHDVGGRAMRVSPPIASLSPSTSSDNTVQTARAGRSMHWQLTSAFPAQFTQMRGPNIIAVIHRWSRTFPQSNTNYSFLLINDMHLFTDVPAFLAGHPTELHDNLSPPVPRLSFQHHRRLDSSLHNPPPSLFGQRFAIWTAPVYFHCCFLSINDI